MAMRKIWTQEKETKG